MFSGSSTRNRDEFSGHLSSVEKRYRTLPFKFKIIITYGATGINGPERV